MLCFWAQIGIWLVTVGNGMLDSRGHWSDPAKLFIYFLSQHHCLVCCHYASKKDRYLERKCWCGVRWPGTSYCDFMTFPHACPCLSEQLSLKFNTACSLRLLSMASCLSASTSPHPLLLPGSHALHFGLIHTCIYISWSGLFYFLKNDDALMPAYCMGKCSDGQTVLFIIIILIEK